MALSHMTAPKPWGGRSARLSKVAKYYKRSASRLRRLAEKRDPESAPSKPAFFGYW